MATFMFLTVCPCRCGELTLSVRRKGNDRIGVLGPELPFSIELCCEAALPEAVIQSPSIKVGP